jgi:hypothetical protein
VESFALRIALRERSSIFRGIVYETTAVSLARWRWRERKWLGAGRIGVLHFLNYHSVLLSILLRSTYNLTKIRTAAVCMDVYVKMKIASFRLNKQSHFKNLLVPV